ncbi:hypothetical protein ACLB2K_013689 [Fragaria x ananassa]
MSSKLQFECSKVSSGKQKLCSSVTLNAKQGVLPGVQMWRAIYRIEAPDVASCSLNFTFIESAKLLEFRFKWSPSQYQIQLFQNLCCLALCFNFIASVFHKRSITSMFAATNKVQKSWEDEKKAYVVQIKASQAVGTIPPNISNCFQLISLDLSVNNLVGKIPPHLRSLSKLQVFLLSVNNLTGENPPSLGNPSSLEIFDARANRKHS